MPEDLPQPHDNLFRSVFGEPAEAAGLLRAHLPPAVAEGLDWSTLATPWGLQHVRPGSPG